MCMPACVSDDLIERYRMEGREDMVEAMLASRELVIHKKELDNLTNEWIPDYLALKFSEISQARTTLTLANSNNHFKPLDSDSSFKIEIYDLSTKSPSNLSQDSEAKLCFEHVQRIYEFYKKSSLLLHKMRNISIYKIRTDQFFNLY